MRGDRGTEPRDTDDLEWRLVDLYLTDGLTGDDAAFVDRWLAVHPDIRSELERVRLVVAGQIVGPDMDPAVMVARLRRRLRGVNGRRVSYGGLSRLGGTTPKHGVWYVVAGLGVAAAVALFVWRGVAGGHQWRAPASVATYVTGRGERANITLNDGTRVTLDVASRLDVPAGYAGGDHTVQLSGEALFTVAHHAGHPLTVMAGGVATRVLGTSFLVRHYATDTATAVAVRDGKVSVHAPSVRTALVLTAAQRVEVGRVGVTGIQYAGPDQFSFTRGVMTLDGVSLPTAITELDRWFNADIRLGDRSLATRLVAGEFTAGSIGDLAADLGMDLNIRVARDGRVLTLYQR